METENKYFKEDVVKYLKNEMGITSGKATEAVNLIFGFIGDSIVEGKDVVVRGFGTFSRRSTKGREVKFGEDKKFDVPEHYTMTFKASKSIKNSLKNLEVE